MRKTYTPVVTLFALILLSGCYKPGPGAESWRVSGLDGGGEDLTAPTTEIIDRVQGLSYQPNNVTPTPNIPIIMPTQRSETVVYTVAAGDTLATIASQYQVSLQDIVTLNNIYNINLIEVGQDLLIPPPSYEQTAPNFKIIPDSELIYSPSNAGFDIVQFVKQQEGYLSAYSEIVDEDTMSGVDILERVAAEYSVNPRLLLTVLEYQSGWVTDLDPDSTTLVYPMLFYDSGREGLYKQLAWAANLLNEGFYLWQLNAITAWLVSDFSVVLVDPTINPGTAGVINLIRYLTSGSEWEQAISENGIYATYYGFFGNPFQAVIEPMVPKTLSQPDLQLPFESGWVWSFTGGPHGGWDTGSAWAALDFAPPGDSLGCFTSNAWVTASGPGEIVYADYGAVIQDLDGDGVWQTGWSILYMHIAPTERVEVGEALEAGDRIGHPSCEGGFSTGTHLHIARRYNGEWIAADGDLPFVMDGWTSEGYGFEYDGYLVKGDITLEAWNGRATFNAIER